MKKITTIAMLTALLVVLTAASNWQSLPTKYYQRTSGLSVSGSVDNGDPSATVYRLGVKLTSSNDTAVFYLPVPVGTSHIGIEWYGDGSYDSLYVGLKYGAVFDILYQDNPVYYQTLQDTTLYWYKTARQYDITQPAELLNARYFVVKARGSAKLDSAGDWLYVKVTIPNK